MPATAPLVDDVHLGSDDELPGRRVGQQRQMVTRLTVDAREKLERLADEDGTLGHAVTLALEHLFPTTAAVSSDPGVTKRLSARRGDKIATTFCLSIDAAYLLRRLATRTSKSYSLVIEEAIHLRHQQRESPDG